MIIYSRTSAKTAETPECSEEDTAFFTVGAELKSKMIYNREWNGGDTNAQELVIIVTECIIDISYLHCVSYLIFRHIIK